jgi:hypothetical protein
MYGVRAFLPAVFAVAVVGFGFYSHRETVTTMPIVEATVANKAAAATASAPADEHTLTRATEAVELLPTAPDRGLEITNLQPAQARSLH